MARGPAIATHAQGGLVGAGSPASRGDVLVLYANGLGAVTRVCHPALRLMAFGVVNRSR